MDIDSKIQTVETDEVRIAERNVQIGDKTVLMTLGLSCGHNGYRNEVVEGSLVFEVICMPIDQVTVIDCDTGKGALAAGPCSLETVLALLSVPGVVYDDNDPFGNAKKLTPDAYVVTGSGIQIVYLEKNVEHIGQDPAYKDIAYNKRFWFGMRTHHKMPEEATSYFGAPGSARQMVGLTDKGKILATHWNDMVSQAAVVRDKRNELGFGRVQNGFCVPPGHVSSIKP